MKDNVKQELDTLLSMVKNWRKSYLDLAEINTDNSILLEDIQQEIEEHVVPFVNRLKQTEYLDSADVYNFFKLIYKELDGLKEDLDNLEEDISPQDLSTMLGQFRVHHDLIYLHREKFSGNHGLFIDKQKLKLAEIAMKLVPYLRRHLCKCDKKCGGSCG